MESVGFADHNITTDHEYYDDGLYDYSSDYEQNFLYEGFYFERIIYQYVWTILVIITCLLNAVVISVLLRKKMRNPTYMILVAISISDSLTGLVTLPSYIAVFQRFSPATVLEASHTVPNWSDLNASHLTPEQVDYLNKFKDSDKPKALPPEGYFLSEDLCDGFMLSKFFLSKTFHTASVWLTLFLALQRFLVVYLPFRTNKLKTKKVIVVCLIVFVAAPFLHVYHLFKDKSVKGFCRWTVSTGKSCDSDCLYFWFVLILGQLIPTILLIIFTVYFTHSILKVVAPLQGSDDSPGTDSSFLDRNRANRLLSIIVTAILVVFLIPELPYAGFLLYLAIFSHADLPQNLEFNRAIHASYEILLILSFNANFYIYTLFNKQFRKALKETILYPLSATSARVRKWSTTAFRGHSFGVSKMSSGDSWSDVQHTQSTQVETKC